MLLLLTKKKYFLLTITTTSIDKKCYSRSAQMCIVWEKNTYTPCTIYVTHLEFNRNVQYLKLFNIQVYCQQQNYCVQKLMPNAVFSNNYLSINNL